MRLYITAAGIYAGTQQEAKADGKGWKLEEVPVSKYELIEYLNALKFGPARGRTLANTEQPDGIERAQMESAYEPTITVKNMSLAPGACPPKYNTYTEQSVAFEDQFEAFPLAQKLHYAALAMEAAREALG